MKKKASKSSEEAWMEYRLRLDKLHGTLEYFRDRYGSAPGIEQCSMILDHCTARKAGKYAFMTACLQGMLSLDAARIEDDSPNTLSRIERLTDGLTQLAWIVEKALATPGTIRSDEQIAEDQNLRQAPRDGLTPAQRDLVIRAYLKPHVEALAKADRCRETVTKVSAKQVAAAIGASKASVVRSEAWKAYEQAWNAKYGRCRSSEGKGRRPSAESYNEAYDEHNDSQDAERQHLIDEQEADMNNYRVLPGERM